MGSLYTREDSASHGGGHAFPRQDGRNREIRGGCGEKRVSFQ